MRLDYNSTNANAFTVSAYNIFITSATAFTGFSLDNTSAGGHVVYFYTVGAAGGDLDIPLAKDGISGCVHRQPAFYWIDNLGEFQSMGSFWGWGGIIGGALPLRLSTQVFRGQHRLLWRWVTARRVIQAVV